MDTNKNVNPINPVNPAKPNNAINPSEPKNSIKPNTPIPPARPYRPVTPIPLLPPAPQDKLTLTVRQLADRLQISMPSAYAMTEQEGFPLLRVGKKKLIPVSGLEMWIVKQTNGSR